LYGAVPRYHGHWSFGDARRPGGARTNINLALQLTAITEADSGAYSAPCANTAGSATQLPFRSRLSPWSSLETLGNGPEWALAPGGSGTLSIYPGPGIATFSMAPQRRTRFLGKHRTDSPPFVTPGLGPQSYSVACHPQWGERTFQGNPCFRSHYPGEPGVS
jgi:hypothetical protein